MSNKSIIQECDVRAREAAARIADFIVKTPLVRSDSFSREYDCNVFFKLENLQTTNSFKLRGATNRVLTLSARERNAGCVAASSGNHGAAVACALHSQGLNGIVFVPEQTASVKTDAIKRHGGDVRLFGTDGLDTEQHARDYARRNGMTYLSPYNDVEVIAGQGSCGVEIAEQLPDIDAVFVAVGGGGLIGGVGSVLKVHNPGVQVFACQPSASAVMAHSVAAGELLELASQATLSDGTAGGIEAGAITFPLVQAVADDFILVEEAEIASAMRRYIAAEKHTIEGAAGVAVAALTARASDLSGANVAVIICGGNIQDDKLAQVLGGA